MAVGVCRVLDRLGADEQCIDEPKQQVAAGHARSDRGVTKHEQKEDAEWAALSANAIDETWK